MLATRDLLERYVEAKDQTRPELMPHIYSPDASLTYSIATDEISFPREVSGVEAITRTLVSDFGQRFGQCRTYYLCDAPPDEDGGVLVLPWLVAMREPATAALRLGKGYYRWEFERDSETRLSVRAMHIFIGRMATIPDVSGDLLKTVQRDLPYPWLKPGELRGIIDHLLEREPTLEFLRAFREPVSLPVGAG